MALREIIARTNAALFRKRDAASMRATAEEIRAHFANPRGQRVLAEILFMTGVTRASPHTGEAGQRYEGARAAGLLIFRAAGGDDGALARAFITNSLTEGMQHDGPIATDTDRGRGRGGGVGERRGRDAAGERRAEPGDDGDAGDIPDGD